MNDLIKNINKLHTAELGIKRIKRNLCIEVDDVVQWCKTNIQSLKERARTGIHIPAITK